MPTPTIPDGELFFNATTWTGNGTSGRAITNGAPGQSFQPDFVWIKIRNQAFFHRLTDSVRGPTIELYSNDTGAEFTQSQGLTSFNSNGFTVGTSTSYNGSGNTYVGWQWKAGGTAVTNTAGSVSAQVSANTTSGFSIVTYTGNATSGATVGHGLGVAPSFIIAKNRNNGATDWPTFHVSTGNNGGCTLNETAAKVTTAIWWNNTTPSSTVVTLGNGAQTNGSGNGIVLYCWAQIAGYSSFGSYNSNASADGPFVYLGFRPRWLMIKKATGSVNANSGWYIYDTARGTINVMGPTLRADLADAESTFNSIDFLSNGFKIRVVDIGINGGTSGDTYIYAAFAENPFKYANAR